MKSESFIDGLYSKMTKLALVIDNIYSKLIALFFTLSILAIAISIYLYPKLPDTIPIHFGASLKADNWGGKGTIFLLSGSFVMLCILFSKKIICIKETTLSVRVLTELIGLAALLMFTIYYVSFSISTF